MRSRTAAFAAALALGLLFAGTSIASPPQGHPQGMHGADQTVVEDCDGGTVTYDGPEWMWPPNHKYRDLTVTAEADNDQQQVALATEGSHDEVGMNGAGNTSDDVDPPGDMDQGTGSAQTEHSIRSERSGQGDGRTYTIMYEAEFGGEPCVGEFTIEVPHDMRDRNPSSE